MDKFRHLEGFFTQQNARMRKEIKSMDLMCQEINCDRQNNKQQPNYFNRQVDFLVVGPKGSGKRSLIKTIHFALNGHQNLQIDTVNLSDTFINRYNVKHSKVQRVEGLKFMKKTSQMLTISSFQIKQKSYFQNQKPFLKMTTKQKLNKFTQKYSEILNLLDTQNAGHFNNNLTNVNNLWRTVSYLVDKDEKQVLPSLGRVKVALVVVNILSLPVSEEIQCLKFFVSQLRKKGLKVLFILTHIDGLNHLLQSQRLNFIEQKIHYLKKKLNICDREDFICIQSYNQLGDRNFRQIYRQQNMNSLSKIRSVDGQNRRRRITEEINVEVPVIRNRFNTKMSLTMAEEEGRSGCQVAGQVRDLNRNCLASRCKEKDQMAELSRVRSSDLFYCNTNNTTLNRTLDNNEQTNFYSLKLLLRIIKQSKKQSKSIPNSLFKWLCG